MPTILITGAKGQLGQELSQLLTGNDEWTVNLTDREELDITKHLQVSSYLAELNDLRYVINCAAYTAVDKAEEDVELAHAVNLNGAQNLARAAKDLGAQMIQISTDYVYHTEQNTPYKEGDNTNPQSVYASTKLAGDNLVQRYHPSAMIVRTSWVYSSFGHNFVKTMLRLGRERDSLSVVFDQIGTPTNARDLAKAIIAVINQVETGAKAQTDMAGVFHYSNEGVTSWYDFAKAIFEMENIDCKLTPIESRQYPTPAKRPPFSVLNKSKIKNAFGLEIPHWKDSLADCLKSLKK